MEENCNRSQGSQRAVVLLKKKKKKKKADVEVKENVRSF